MACDRECCWGGRGTILRCPSMVESKTLSTVSMIGARVAIGRSTIRPALTSGGGPAGAIVAVAAGDCFGWLLAIGVGGDASPASGKGSRHRPGLPGPDAPARRYSRSSPTGFASTSLRSARSHSTKMPARSCMTPFSGRVTRVIAKIGDEVKARRSAVRDRQSRGRAGADRPDRGVARASTRRNRT